MAEKFVMLGHDIHYPSPEDELTHELIGAFERADRSDVNSILRHIWPLLKKADTGVLDLTVERLHREGIELLGENKIQAAEHLLMLSALSALIRPVKRD